MFNESNLLLELILKGQFGPGKEFFLPHEDGTTSVELLKMIEGGYQQLAMAVLSGDNLDSFYFRDSTKSLNLALERKEEDLAWLIYTKAHPCYVGKPHSGVSYAIKCQCNKFLANYLEKVSDVRKDMTLYHINAEGPAKSTLLECAIIYKNLEAVKMLVNADADDTYHGQFLYSDENRRNAFGVAAIMTVADQENKIFLETLLEAMKKWNKPKRVDAICWTNSQLSYYRKDGEKYDENDFFRKESGLAEEKYADADYKEVSKFVSSFFDEMDEWENWKSRFRMEQRYAKEEEARKKRDAEREAKWLAEMKDRAELENAAAMFDIGGSPHFL